VRASLGHRLRRPHGYETCGECAGVILLRHRPERRVSVAADRPMWEEYQEALREHPEFMMTDDELQRAEELGPYWGFFELTQLQ
jgi:hypothetical protein